VRITSFGTSARWVLNIITGYEPPSPDGERHLALVIALEFDSDEEKELGPIDDSIRAAHPHALVGPDVWEHASPPNEP
jgi:hypothetical protein